MPLVFLTVPSSSIWNTAWLLTSSTLTMSKSVESSRSLILASAAVSLGKSPAPGRPDSGLVSLTQFLTCSS